MARLIDELKRDHAEMEQMLRKVRESGVGTREGHKILQAAQASLLAHLRKEDLQLYPALKTAAATDQQLRMTLDLLAKDMDQITRKATEFFQKYAAPDAKGDLVFAQDLGRLLAILTQRMRNEEMKLYSEFEKRNLGGRA
ncbi:hemerythrin domain-containing protein [Geomesophilobacter sediminis]|uniref:Hemerythrin domain-containing protein n=1 Tax=Geomesophilobacter sediminis TaxID=2798584 RepID=A0A8J7M1F1_9BACT|nr:hemerythrin domain-containing protein [Geomesophilobacter sediminis]MBJ6726699.1 hemerythrin domain-containing protein [Geomesophilobacter sediminis]